MSDVTAGNGIDGGADELIGSKAVSSSGSPTVRRRRLGAELRRLREAAGYTVPDAAEKMDVTASTIYRMELGRVGVKPRDVHEFVRLYNETDSDLIKELVTLAREGRKRGWWAKYSDTVAPPYATYIGLEQEASSLFLFDGLVINGLLQTRDYAEATFDYAAVGSKKYREKRISLRMERQQRLSRDLKIWSVLDESAIRRTLGGEKVMREQLQHLLRLAEYPNVTLQVLPFQGGAYPGMLGSFIIMEFQNEEDPDLRHPDVVFIEGHSGDVFEEGEGVDLFKTGFDNLRAASLSPVSSLEFIEKAANDLA